MKVVSQIWWYYIEKLFLNGNAATPRNRYLTEEGRWGRAMHSEQLAAKNSSSFISILIVLLFFNLLSYLKQKIKAE